MELAGKVAVVTGASMGIGEAIAKLFVDRGARVILLSRDSNRAEAARHRVGRTEQTLALSCDVRNREEIDRVLSLTLHHFDRIDIWVNNAAGNGRDHQYLQRRRARPAALPRRLFGHKVCAERNRKRSAD
jgi:NAD(P)-dependent dehydrogenase (short-subunit alcohol dehydrogenase family)